MTAKKKSAENAEPESCEIFSVHGIMRIRKGNVMNFKVTRYAIGGMGVLCGALCAAGPWLVSYVIQRPSPLIGGTSRYVMLLVLGYFLAALAFICLRDLYRLIRRIEQNEIFVCANVESLRRIAAEVAAAAVLSLILGLTCAIFMLAVCVMAAFMVLIIRVIRHSFECAVRMKDELDLTI